MEPIDINITNDVVNVEVSRFGASSPGRGIIDAEIVGNDLIFTYDKTPLTQNVGRVVGENGTNGTNGTDGWSPILAVVVDGERDVLQVADWTGGTGTKPTTGQYIGASGLVNNIAEAVDIRGAAGPSNTGLLANNWVFTDHFSGNTITSDLNYRISTQNSGTTVNVYDQTGVYGVLRLLTSASFTTSGTGFIRPANAAAFPIPITGTYRAQIAISFANLPASPTADKFIFRHCAFNGSAQVGIRLRWDDTSGRAIFECYSNNGTTETVLPPSAIAPVINTWFTLAFELVGRDSISFWINNTYQGIISSNMPIGVLLSYFAQLTNNAVASSVNTAYIDVFQETYIRASALSWKLW